MAPNLSVRVLEHSQVSPPPDTNISELSIPLAVFDMALSCVHAMQLLLCYNFPHPNTYFLETIVPNLKQSLSLTLKHYIPLAGNLVYPSNSGMPEFQYVEGDSIPLIIAECDYDFNYLKGYHPRNADDFHPLFHNLPQFPSTISIYKKCALLAVKLTVFSNVGFTIGCTVHHSIGDGSSMINFFKAWASINKLGSDAGLVESGILSCFHRSQIKDPYGLAAISWNAFKVDIYNRLSQLEDELRFDFNKVRATYVVTREHIQKLKSILVLNKRSASVHLSSFTITCAYVWTCLVKSGAAALEEKMDENQHEYFVFPADLRTRLNPPLPANYFGNCLGVGIAKVTRSQLIGNEGFIVAELSIAKAIETMVNIEIEYLGDVGKHWIKSFGEVVNWQRVLGVSGSPKFDAYSLDYGWGKPEKFEIVSIDHETIMSLSKSRNSEGGLEVGLSLSKMQMDAFEDLFNQGLRTIM